MGGGGWEGVVCSLANYSVAYEETPSNRDSDFRDFVCSLFPMANLFDFYFTLTFITPYENSADGKLDVFFSL